MSSWCRRNNSTRINFLLKIYNLFSYCIKSLTLIIHFKTFFFQFYVIKTLFQRCFVNALKFCKILMNFTTFEKLFLYEFFSTINTTITIRNIYCFSQSLIMIVYFGFVDLTKKIKILFLILFFIKLNSQFARDVNIVFTKHALFVVCKIYENVNLSFFNCVLKKKFCKILTHIAFKIIIFLIYFSTSQVYIVMWIKNATFLC